MNESLTYIYCKKGNCNLKPFILNKVVSYNNIEVASFIDENIFFRDENITLEMLRLNLPVYKNVPFINYVKKDDVVDEEFEFLFMLIRKYFKWSVKEFNYMKDVVLNKLKDKNEMKNYFEFFGVERKYYKKYDLNMGNSNIGLSKYI